MAPWLMCILVLQLMRAPAVSLDYLVLLATDLCQSFGSSVVRGCSALRGCISGESADSQNCSKHHRRSARVQPHAQAQLEQAYLHGNQYIRVSSDAFRA